MISKEFQLQPGLNEIKVDPKFIGVPFLWQGRTLVGTDCVGLVWMFLKDNGIVKEDTDGSEYDKDWEKNDPQRLVKALVKVGRRIDKQEDLQPFDVILFKINGVVNHVGVYIGYNKFLHVHAGSNSAIGRLSTLWGKFFYCAVRPTEPGSNEELYKEIENIEVGAPVVAAIVAIVSIFTAVAAATGSVLVAALVTTVVAVASVVAIVTAPKPPKPNFGSSNPSVEGSPRYSSFGALQNTASSELPVPVLYGELKLFGNAIYQSEPGETVYRCDALCEGEVNSISTVKVNDIDITSLEGCSVTTYTGTTTQTVDSRFSSRVSGLRNLVYLALTLKSSDKLKGGFPTVSCLVQGSKIKTWNGSVWSAGTIYSDNPAACVRDFLINTRYGVGLNESLIDNASFGEVYDYCDVSVSNNDGGTEKRYILNYIIDVKRPATDILQDMCNCFGGFLIWAGNKLKLRVEKVENVVQNFTMDNIVEGSFSYQYTPKDSMINRLKVQYIDPTQNYTKVYAMAEDKIDQDERSAIEGGNGVFEKELSLLGVTKFSRASRIANYSLKSNKAAPIICKFKVGIYAIHCEPGDVVSVSHDVSDWVNKPFRIVNMKEEPNDEMSLVCKEYNDSVYDDSYGSGISIYSYGAPQLPTQPLGNVSNITLSESDLYVNKDGTVVSDILIGFTAPSTGLDYFSHYNIELKKGSGSYIPVGITGTTSFKISIVEALVAYQVRIKTVSIYGLLSSGIESSAFTPVGKTAPPGDVSYFSVLQEGDNLNFEWTSITDADVAGYEIREGISWQSAQFIVKTLPSENTHSLSTFNAGSKTYRIKSFDTSGNYSVNDTTDSIVLTAKPSSVVIGTFGQWSRFGEIIVSEKIQQSWVNAYDSTYNRRAYTIKTQNRWDGSGTWDNPSEANAWDRNIETAEGTWSTNVWDIGGVLQGLHTLDIRHLIGFGSSFTMEYRISDDTVTWSDWKLYVAGYISGRFMQFRGTIQAGDTNNNITTYHAVGTITLATSEQQQLNAVVASGGSTFAFSPNYTGLQSIVITTVGSSPLRPRITSQNVLGFAVILEDKNDVSQVGNINWRSMGY